MHFQQVDQITSSIVLKANSEEMLRHISKIFLITLNIDNILKYCTNALIDAFSTFRSSYMYVATHVRLY